MITGVTGVISFVNTHIGTAPFLKNLTVAGGLSASTCKFTSLDLSGLQSFSGNISLSVLENLTSLKIGALVRIGDLNLADLPLLTDLSTLGNIQTATSISLINDGATKIAMDNLSAVTGSGISFDLNAKLSDISFKSLNTISGPLTIFGCLHLAAVDFDGLKSITGRLTVFGTNLSDLVGFNKLQNLGALNVTSNPLLGSLHGLEQLTTFSLPGINGNVHFAGGLSVGLKGLSAELGGIAIQSNPSLVSLSGLQNVSTIPVAYIADNTELNDFCPFKASMNILNTTSNYDYTYIDDPAGMTYKRTLPALTVITNGNYNSTQDALNAIATCK